MLLTHLQLSTLSWVIESLDLVEYICPRFSARSTQLAIYSLALEHAKEALGRCVVSTAAYRTHVGHRIVSLQETLVLVTGDLTAAVRMQDDRGFCLTFHSAMSTA